MIRNSLRPYDTCIFAKGRDIISHLIFNELQPCNILYKEPKPRNQHVLIIQYLTDITFHES